MRTIAFVPLSKDKSKLRTAPSGIVLALALIMGAAETNTISPTSHAWELTDLTPTQWRRLEARLSDDERETLEGLRKQWLNAAGLLEVWLDPVLYESDLSYERALAAVESAETEFHEFVRRIRQSYGI